MTLMDSCDAMVSNNAPTLVAGHKWRPTSAVEEAAATLRLADIVGHVQQGRGDFGLTTRPPAWNRATASERKKLVVEEIHRKK